MIGITSSIFVEYLTTVPLLAYHLLLIVVN